MTNATTAMTGRFAIGTNILARCLHAYLWITGWAARSVPVDKDGIPHEARRIVDHGIYYL